MPIRSAARATVLALVAACGLAAAGCESAAPYDARRPARASKLEHGLVEVSAVLADGVVLVPVRVNGRGPFQFALDTGSTTVVVSERVAGAADLDVERRRGSVVTEAGRSDGTVEHSLVRDLRVGDARFRLVSALVADLSELSVGIGSRLDGILGMPVLRHHVWTIDSAAGLVRIESGDAAAGASGATGAAESLPLEMDEGLPAVWIDVAGRRTLAIVDTGQRMPLALGPADADALRPRLRVIGGSVGQVLDGEVRRDVARLDGDVRIGPIALRAPAVVLGRMTRIGMHAFQGRAVTLDAARSRIVLGAAP